MGRDYVVRRCVNRLRWGAVRWQWKLRIHRTGWKAGCDSLWPWVRFIIDVLFISAGRHSSLHRLLHPSLQSYYTRSASPSFSDRLKCLAGVTAGHRVGRKEVAKDIAQECHRLFLISLVSSVPSREYSWGINRPWSTHNWVNNAWANEEEEQLKSKNSTMVHRHNISQDSTLYRSINLIPIWISALLFYCPFLAIFLRHPPLPLY